MPYNIKDPRTDQFIGELARVKGKLILDFIREVCENELQRERRKSPLWDRLRPPVSRVAVAPKTRKKAGRTVFDELSGDAPS